MILIVDDDPSVTASLALALKQAGRPSHAVSSPSAALSWLEREPCALVLQDMNFSRRTSGEEGLELLARIRGLRPDLPVILITAWGSIGLAVAGMKAGASDFITKPILLDHLHLTINRILQESRLKEEAELAVYYKNLSRTDELTGLYNFRHLVSLLKSEVTRHLRYNRTMSLAMIDIDDFKSYNDSRGHEEGNELLMRLSHVFRHNTRNCDVLARYGGEEFVIIFPETALEEAVIVAERICRTVSVTLEVSVTIGLAGLPRHTADYNELIRMADRAMYWGKQHGKNQIVVYDDSMSTCK